MSQDAYRAPHPTQPGAGPYPPPYGHQPYPQAPPPTNTLAILALVFAFVFAPAGIVLGILARKQIRRTGEGGDGLALGGLIVGVVATVLAVVYIAIVIAAIGAAAAQIPDYSTYPTYR